MQLLATCSPAEDINETCQCETGIVGLFRRGPGLLSAIFESNPEGLIRFESGNRDRYIVNAPGFGRCRGKMGDRSGRGSQFGHGKLFLPEIVADCELLLRTRQHPAALVRFGSELKFILHRRAVAQPVEGFSGKKVQPCSGDAQLITVDASRERLSSQPRPERNKQ